MVWEAWFTLGVIALVIGLLIATRMAPDVLMAGGLTLLLVTGVLGPQEALVGFSNQGMITVGVLFVVVSGLQETGALSWVVHHVLGRPRSLIMAQLRMMVPVQVMSAFLNNTPVVAMLIPAVHEWARKNQLAVSKLLIPLSYAAILGGTCTLIGTSTNLVVNGMLMAESDGPGLAMFDLAWVGLPAALLGLAYILFIGQRWLPDRQPALSDMRDPRQYMVEMTVEPDSPLVGRTIEEAGLRHLPALFLVEIERDGQVLPAASPKEELHAGDQLVFAGVIESVVDLQKIKGLKPATDQIFKLDGNRAQRLMVEAVVSNTCPAVGRSIRESRFRTVYNAAVIAVARNGERLRGKIGDIVLQPGDTLLLEAHPEFVEQQRNSRDFFLVSSIADSAPPRHEKSAVAGAILAGLVVAVTAGWFSMLEAAMLAAGAMLMTGCTSASVARRQVDWQVLIVIAAALGIGQALAHTGAAQGVSQALMAVVGDGPWPTLAAVYVATWLFTAVITNVAAAALMFPIALAASESLGVSFTPFVIAIMVAASASFATPIGYQTNMMVYGPGGYRFADFLRVGLPLDALLAVITLSLAPRVWPF